MIMSKVMPHCCTTMAGYIDPKYAQHSDPAECEDALVKYDPRFDSYALLPRFGALWVTAINFCLWCGAAKREPRDLYFDELEALDIDAAIGDEVPAEFRTDQWWKKRGL